MHVNKIQKTKTESEREKERHERPTKSHIFIFNKFCTQLPMGFGFKFYLTHDTHFFPAQWHIFFSFRCSSLWCNAAHTLQRCTTLNKKQTHTHIQTWVQIKWNDQMSDTLHTKIRMHIAVNEKKIIQFRSGWMQWLSILDIFAVCKCNRSLLALLCCPNHRLSLIIIATPVQRIQR